jgi:prepilin-type N-terminal cleavage/methylation domain-containing protein
MRSQRRQRGFTLLEVMVALMLIGIGFAMALSAMSGSLKLTRLASEHENAMLLAKARLDEVAQNPGYQFAEEASEEVYGGTEFSYKIEFRPVPLLDDRMAERVKLSFRLEELTINVYWGPDGKNTYSLTTYKMTPNDPGKDAGAKPGAPPANAPGTPGAPGGQGAAPPASGNAPAPTPAPNPFRMGT